MPNDCGFPKLKTATLYQHFDDMLHRVRTEFERIGGIDPAFENPTRNKNVWNKQE